MTTENPSFKPEVSPCKEWSGKILHYEASLFGFIATGQTKDEALQNLHKTMSLIKPYQGTHGPRIIHYKDWVALVWYHTELGYVYGVRHEDDTRDVSPGTLVGPPRHSLGSFNEVEEQARLELAVRSYVPNIQDTAKVEHPEFCLTTEHRKEFQRRALMANRYQYAIQVKKMSADDAHKYATRCPQRADLWASDEK